MPFHTRHNKTPDRPLSNLNTKEIKHYFDVIIEQKTDDLSPKQGRLASEESKTGYRNPFEGFIPGLKAALPFGRREVSAIPVIGGPVLKKMDDAMKAYDALLELNKQVGDRYLDPALPWRDAAPIDPDSSLSRLISGDIKINPSALGDMVLNFGSPYQQIQALEAGGGKQFIEEFSGEFRERPLLEQITADPGLIMGTPALLRGGAQAIKTGASALRGIGRKGAAKGLEQAVDQIPTQVPGDAFSAYRGPIMSRGFDEAVGQIPASVSSPRNIDRRDYIDALRRQGIEPEDIREPTLRESVRLEQVEKELDEMIMRGASPITGGRTDPRFQPLFEEYSALRGKGERYLGDVQVSPTTFSSGGTGITPRSIAEAQRMAKPIATGKKALANRIDFEVRLGGLDPETGNATKEFLNMLPSKYLDDLGSSYIKTPIQPEQTASGMYTPAGDLIKGKRSPAIITIAKHLMQPMPDAPSFAPGFYRPDKAIIHEIAHHLEQFVTPRDVAKLRKQWNRDFASQGQSVADELLKYRQQRLTSPDGIATLTEDEYGIIRNSYRFYMPSIDDAGGTLNRTHFAEWFAEVMTNKALRDIYMEIPVYRNVISKALASIRVIAKAGRDFIATKLGRGDDAENVYNRLIRGDYTPAERRSSREVFRDYEGVSPAYMDPTMPPTGPKLPRELAGAKPNYNMGMSRYTPQFESDLDKALFIVSQSKKSARDESYMRWLRGQLNLSDAQLRIAGNKVRSHMKATLTGQPEGTVRIPISPTVREQAVSISPTTAAPIPPAVLDNATIAGGRFKHFTTPEAKAQLEAGSPFDPSLLPQHGTGSLGRENRTGKFAGNRLYLSLDDQRWSTVHEQRLDGEIVEATSANKGIGGTPFFDYDKQKFMKSMNEDIVTTLSPVEFEISPNARILNIDSYEDYARVRNQYGHLLDTETQDYIWNNIARDYDVVSVRNRDKLIKGPEHRSGAHDFYNMIGGDQLIVLNPRAASVVRPRVAVQSSIFPTPTAVPPTTAAPIPPAARALETASIEAVEQLKVMVKPEGVNQRMYDQLVEAAPTLSDAQIDEQIKTSTKMIGDLRKSKTPSDVPPEFNAISIHSLAIRIVKAEKARRAGILPTAVPPTTAAPVTPAARALEEAVSIPKSVGLEGETAAKIAMLRTRIEAYENPGVRVGSEGYDSFSAGLTPKMKGKQGIEPKMQLTEAEHLENIKYAQDEVRAAKEGLDDAKREGILEPEDIADLQESLKEARLDLKEAKKPIDFKAHAEHVDEYQQFLARSEDERQGMIKELAELEATPAARTLVSSDALSGLEKIKSESGIGGRASLSDTEIAEIHDIIQPVDSLGQSIAGKLTIGRYTRPGPLGTSGPSTEIYLGVLPEELHQSYGRYVVWNINDNTFGIHSTTPTNREQETILQMIREYQQRPEGIEGYIGKKHPDADNTIRLLGWEETLGAPTTAAPTRAAQPLIDPVTAVPPRIPTTLAEEVAPISRVADIGEEATGPWETLRAPWEPEFGSPIGTPPRGIISEAAQPPEDAGRKFIAMLRPLLDVVDEVVTTDNPILKKLTSGINPSIARNTETGRIVTAYRRQEIAIDEITDVALAAAFDVHADRWTGRIDRLLPINSDGMWANTKVHWNDVFSSPDKYDLRPETRALIDDLLSLVTEVDDMRISAGLPSLAKSLPKGKFYFPRNVDVVRGVKIEGKSSPALERMYEDATEGVSKGIEYSIDPRAVVEIHVKRGLHDVLSKQLDDALEPLSVTGKDIVAARKGGPELISQMQAAIISRQSAERAFNKTYVPQEQRMLLNKTNEGKAFITRIDAERKVAQTKLQIEKNNYSRIKDTYRNKLKQVTGDGKNIPPTEVAPGQLFGPNRPNEIAVDTWRNRFFPRELVKELEEGIELSASGQPIGPWKALQVTGNTVRFLSSVGDFAMPLIHGQTVLAANPKAWAKMLVRHHQAFFDPTVTGRLIRDNLEEYQWLARNAVPIGDPEFFAALAPGQGISLDLLLSKVPKGGEIQRFLRFGGKQSFGRFQAAYTTGLGWARVNLLKSMRSTWQGTDAELAQYLRNMTGGLDSRALDVRPSQRAVEGMWLAFSPRLLRSTMALAGDAMRPTTPQGRAALRTLANYVLGITGIFIASGLALGKSWEQIGESLNPLAGRRFLSHEINGDWIGVGGQIRALMQFMASLTSTLSPGGKPIEQLWAIHQFNNPIMNFYMSRGAVAVNIVGGGIEAFGPGNIDALPFEELDGPIDFFKHIGTSALPFAIQGALEGLNPSTTALEFFGARGVPSQLDKETLRLYGQEYRDVNKVQQILTKNKLQLTNRVFADIEEERQIKQIRVGTAPTWEYSEYNNLENFYRGRRKQAGIDFEYEPANLNDSDLNRRALAFYNSFLDPDLHPELRGPATVIGDISVPGDINWDAVEKAQRKLIKDWPSVQGIAWPTQYILINSNLRPIHPRTLRSISGAEGRRIRASHMARLKFFANNPEALEDYKNWFLLTDIPQAPMKTQPSLNTLEQDQRYFDNLLAPTQTQPVRAERKPLRDLNEKELRHYFEVTLAPR